MGRRLKLKTRELGQIEVYLIYGRANAWEPYWEPVRQTVAALVTTLPKETVENALKGWTSPLVKGLGIQPIGALKQLPAEAKTCALQKGCPYYVAAQCHPEGRKMPVCFESRAAKEEVGQRLAELITMWREGVYVILELEA